VDPVHCDLRLSDSLVREIPLALCVGGIVFDLDDESAEGRRKQIPPDLKWRITVERLRLTH